MVRELAAFSITYANVCRTWRPNPAGHPEPPRDPGRPDGAGDRRTLRYEPASRIAAFEGAGARRPHRARTRRAETSVSAECRASRRDGRLVRPHPRRLGGALRPSGTIPRNDK